MEGHIFFFYLCVSAFVANKQKQHHTGHWTTHSFYVFSMRDTYTIKLTDEQRRPSVPHCSQIVINAEDIKYPWLSKWYVFFATNWYRSIYVVQWIRYCVYCVRKRCHFIFEYNSQGTPWSIVIIIAHLETGMNTSQSHLIYLLKWPDNVITVRYRSHESLLHKTRDKKNVQLYSWI